MAFEAIITVIAIAITAIATFVIAWFTVVLAGVGRRQIADTRVLERAYLAVEPEGIRPMRSDIGKLLGFVAVKNAGHLPARNVRAYVRFKYAHGDGYNDFPQGPGNGTFVVSPGITLRQGSGDTIERSDILKLPKEKLFFYVFGAVYYHDGFVDGRQTRFCHRYRWEIFGDEGSRLSAPATEARYHEYGNGTDEGDGREKNDCS